MTRKVVLLLSGGLDSVLTLAELVAKPVDEVERVHALIIFYDQSSKIEVEKAKELCEAWKVPYTILHTSLSGVADTHAEIPARNLLFISYAASLAMQMHFNTIAVGFEPDSTYTDSTVVFAERVNELLDLFDLELVTPVKHYENKLALVVRALDLGVPLHLCHSSRSNDVDGKCKTSKLFLDALRTLFSTEPDPQVILKQLSGLRCDYHLAKNTYYVRYVFGEKRQSFKYAAALFAIASKQMWDHKIHVYSTGSWMDDLKAVSTLYGKREFFEFHKTDNMISLFEQELNPASWGLKQALSLLPRARYLKGITCRSTQGRLVSALRELGYKVQPVTGSPYPYLETVGE